MKLNRAQEKFLIDLGLTKVIETLMTTKTVKPKPVKKKRGWSAERHARFAATMAKTWRKKRRAKKNSLPTN